MALKRDTDHYFVCKISLPHKAILRLGHNHPDMTKGLNYAHPSTSYLERKMLLKLKIKTNFLIECILDWILDLALHPRFIATTNLVDWSCPVRFRYSYIINQKLQRACLYDRLQKLKKSTPTTAKVWWSRGLHNFGDELTPYLLAYLAGVDCKFSRGMEFISVGSIVRFAADHTYVWGSGVIKQSEMQTTRPKVLALRGPMSKNQLERQGIVCPNVFGDPAMLLPTIFQPHPKLKVAKLLAPHFKQTNAFRHLANIHLLSLETKSVLDIENIIETICSAERVVTSSLHVFIVCVAYKVPVAVFSWASIPIGGDGVKFEDFCRGIGARSQRIFEINSPNEENMRELFCKAEIVNHSFDSRALLNALRHRFPTQRLEQVLAAKPSY